MKNLSKMNLRQLADNEVNPKARLWESDLGDGTYRNPILFADYSDPDVIRVDDVFYMTASSFNYLPGLPILTSKDLVNWELKNYAVLILPGKGYIDPCPFWDEDGKVYLVHGYAKSRIGFKSFLGIFELSEDGLKATGRDRFIYDGTLSQPTVEGPKVYKRNGYYYIFAPAGGVKFGWQSVLRSKNMEGPYEEKKVMHQGDTIINGPHQGALVDTITGEEWFIHFQDKGAYGRITHLQPVKWTEDWPVIGVNPDENQIGEPCLIHRKPDTGFQEEPNYLKASDDFSGQNLGLMWQWTGNFKEDYYSLEGPETQEANGKNPENTCLRLFSLNTRDEDVPILWHSTNLLTQKILCPSFTAEVKVKPGHLKDNERTGFALFGGQYAYIGVEKSQGSFWLIYVESQSEGEGIVEKVKFKEELTKMEKSIKLVIRLEEAGMSASMKAYSGESIETGHSFSPSEDTWVGAKLGIFSLAMDREDDHGYAEFEYVKVIK